MQDIKTRNYFNNLTPSYNPKRIEFALKFIRDNSDSDTRLIDIGCGNGTTLMFVRENTAVKNLTGLDISEEYLKVVRENVACETVLGSVLDFNIIENLKAKYDFCLLVAVLHHMIGRNRNESFMNATRCLTNSMLLLKPGGHLILYEPAYNFRLLMDMIFYVKKFFSGFSDKRIELFSKWINIGNPVVSYYSQQQLDKMVNTLNVENVMRAMVNRRRKGLILRRTGMGLVLKKNL